MSRQDLVAGRRWVERRFEEIAHGFGAPRSLTQEDRWHENHTATRDEHSMAYYIELAGHLMWGEVGFWGVDLEIAGAGELAAREKLARQLQDALTTSAGARA